MEQHMVPSIDTSMLPCQVAATAPVPLHEVLVGNATLATNVLTCDQHCPSTPNNTILHSQSALSSCNESHIM